MGIFDIFRKKQKAAAPAATDGRLDDVTFIRDMKHAAQGAWQQYDVLLAARGYGWATMLDWADYLACADLEHVSQVTSAAPGAQAADVTDSYHAHGDRCTQTPELQEESGMLSLAGVSRALQMPMKVVWFNQTQMLRFFTFADDELLVRKYAETLVRRSFGTKGAMKLGRDIPEGQ